MRRPSHLSTIALASVLVVVALFARQAKASEAEVVFVCEHGSVKSLIAASYFNELARERGLPFRAISRGSAPASDTVPDAIKSKLAAEGFDVTHYRPAAVSQDDVADATHIVAIGTSLSQSLAAPDKAVEEWNDVPPASSNYLATSAALKERVSELLERMARARP